MTISNTQCNQTASTDLDEVDVADAWQQCVFTRMPGNNMFTPFPPLASGKRKALQPLWIWLLCLPLVKKALDATHYIQHEHMNNTLYIYMYTESQAAAFSSDSFSGALST